MTAWALPGSAGAALTLRNQTDGFVLALLENLERTRDATSVADVRKLREFDDLLDPEALAVVPRDVVRPTALGGWGLLRPPATPRRSDDEDIA